MEEDTVTVRLTQGKETIIDARFVPQVLSHKWYARKRGNTFYAARSVAIKDNQGREKIRSIRLHRFLYQLAYGEAPAGKEIDHINGNGLDNRIANLRAVTIRENQQNQARHRAGKLAGTWKRGNRWVAVARVKGRKKWLGTFRTEEEAHAAYLQALAEKS